MNEDTQLDRQPLPAAVHRRWDGARTYAQPARPVMVDKTVVWADGGWEPESPQETE